MELRAAQDVVLTAVGQDGLALQYAAEAMRAQPWAPEFGVGRIGFPPPEKNELVLSVETGCAGTVPFQPKPYTPF